MMSVIESPGAGAVTKIDVGIIDCDVHPLPKDSEPVSVPRPALAGAFGTIRHASAPALH